MRTLKYVNTQIGFAEVPSEISLLINISNCPCHCKNCHSPYLAEDIGEPLNRVSIAKLIEENKGITCVCFMGGDSNPTIIEALAIIVKNHYPKLRVAWYSGRQTLPYAFSLKWFDYVKLGSYIEELGPLNSKTTNQRFYIVEKLYCDNDNYKYDLKDITYKFWKDND